MKKVLITAPYFQPVVERFLPLFAEHGIEAVVPKVNERMSEEELLPLIGDIDGILCGDDRITERVLAAAPKLKTIVKWGTGIDSIDKEAAAKRGIPVRNTLNAFTEPVSDTIMAFILAFARGTLDLDAKIRKGIWEKKLNKALNECTIGVIGVGNIGSAVIKRAQAFGAKVVAHDIVEKPHDFMVPLEDLLRAADFVVLATDLNPTSRQIMDEKTIALMKPTAYLINAARGPLVEEKALIGALQGGKLAGAGLDVFEEEPLPESHPYRQMNNVILSPHNSNSSLKAWERVHQNSVDQLLADLAQG
jgi:D-3-phosphoglycerate dehydrogenase